jgi:hypothetical protein
MVIQTSVSGLEGLIGQLTDPFDLVLASGTEFELRIPVGPGTKTGIVGVSQNIPMYQVLFCQAFHHISGGYVPPVMGQFVYHPRLWSNKDSSTWATLEGVQVSGPPGTRIAQTSVAVESKSEAEFAKMLTECYIDHRTTSRYPQASSLDLTGARMDIVPTPVALTTSRASSSLHLGTSRPVVSHRNTLRQHDGNSNGDDAPQGIRTQDVDRHAKCLRQVDFAFHKATQLSDHIYDPPLSNTRVTPHPHGDKVACDELCMNSVAATFFTASQKGVILYEPFGGLCAGLEMIIHCGIPVNKYLYSDIDPIAQSLAQVRIETLHIQYGALFPSRAFKSPFALPQDINLVTSDNLLRHGAYDQDAQWIVVAELECQDLSPAWQGKGLTGPRSSTFYPLIHLCSTLQLLHPTLPPAFLFENTAMQTHKDPNISVRDFDWFHHWSARAT